MEFLKAENLFFFITMFLPGFISVKVYHSIVANDNYDFSKNLLEIIGYSVINFLLNSWLILLGISNDWIFIQSSWIYPSIFWIFFISPVLWPIILNRLLRWRILKRYVLSNQKSAWDYYFNLRRSAYVIVHLNDGTRVGGYFGTNSYASRYPCKEALYLETAWELRDVSDERKFKKVAEQTNGLLILNGNIKYIEFFTT
ncbi:DUF6338 family protein [Pedobacter sp. JY14-1]|uniref:DUF6338 family protein n=1 Tax=Pedobacter sp. JY14-1 TaxID=3034151 RepID=UPI0023E1FC57|nr:DUF6338 family protein [Pedobacter sp. JY14-1]